MDEWDPERIKALMEAAGMGYGAPAGAASLDLNYAIPSGTDDVGPIQIDRPTPPAVNPPPPPVDTSNMTDAQYADWLESQGAKPLRNDQGAWIAGGNSPDLVLSGPSGKAPVTVGGPPPVPKAEGDKDYQPPVTFSGGGAGPSSSGPLGIGPGQYVNIPGRDVPLVSPETRALVDSGPRAELGAVNAQRDADQAKVDAARQFAQARAEAYDRMLQEQQQREQQRQAVLRQQENDMERVSDQVSRTLIDPDHLWKTKNAGQMVAGFVAAMLGGYLAGKHGGPNQYLQMIDKEIDNDIAAQKANYEIKRGKLNDMRSVYAQKMARFGDERAAEAAAKNDMLAAVMARGDQMAANADSEQVNANWAKGKAMIADRIGKNATTYTKWQPPQAVQVGGGMMGAGTVEGQPINIGDGKFIIANGPVAPELAKKVAAAAAMQTGLQRLQTLYKQRGATDKIAGDTSAIQQQINQELANIAQQRTVFAGQGAMSEGDKRVADTANGVLTGLANITGDPSQLIGQAIRDINDSKDQYARAIGGRVYRNAGVQRSPKGELKEQWIPTGEFYGDSTAGSSAGPTTFQKDK